MTHGAGRYNGLSDALAFWGKQGQLRVAGFLPARRRRLSPAQRPVQAEAPRSKFLSAKVKSGCSEGGSPSSLGREAPEFRTKELDGKV